MRSTRFAAALVIGALALLGYGACNRIVDLTPDAPIPDSSGGNSDSAVTPDASIGPDGGDATPFDSSPDGA